MVRVGCGIINYKSYNSIIETANITVSCVRNVYVVVASSTAVSDPGQARRLGHASIGLSIAGIVVTVVVIILVAGVTSRASDDVSSTYCEYNIYGTCYEHRSYQYTYSYCSGVKYNNYCYYNWFLSHQSSCSSHCSNTVRPSINRLVQHIIPMLQNDLSLLQDRSRCPILPKFHDRKCHF